MQFSPSAPLSRRSLAAAIGLALATSTAHADTFPVTTNADAGTGSLRGALNAANGAAGPHTIDLSAISGQTITLASDLPQIEEDLTLQGSDVTLSGDEQHGCLVADGADLTVNSMTVTQCVATQTDGGIQSPNGEGRGIIGPTPDYAGGGIRVTFGDLTINDSTITGNEAPYALESYYGVGGGVAVKYGDLEINNSTISNNTAYGGGGIYAAGFATINDSVIADNTSYKYGGGIASLLPGGPVPVRGMQASLLLDGTTVSGNSSAVGGGIFAFGVLSMNASEVSGNDGTEAFGGVAAFVPPGGAAPPHQVVDSTISDNSAYYAYGGMLLGGSASISGTTISGNQSQEYGGGLFLISKYESDQISVDNSTISGNSSAGAAGVVVYGYAYDGSYSQVSFNGVTITGNSATSGYGGGVLAFADGGDIPFGFSNSIIAGNSAAQGSADLSASAGNQPVSDLRLALDSYWRPDRGGPVPGETIFNVTFSLLGEAPDSGTFNPDAATSSLLGSSPQLGALADNGGPTLTHLPAGSSPAVDALPAGSGGCGTSFNIDQRGESRPFGDGCDLGSIEITGTQPPPPGQAISVPVLDRFGLLVLALGAGLLGLFGLGRRRREG